MYLLLESIKLLDGIFFNLPYHQQRMQRSLADLYRKGATIDLSAELGKVAKPDKGLYKCRVLYTQSVEEIEFTPYQRKSIKTLKIVEDDTIAYEHKLNDRSTLDKLTSKKEDCDDVLIIKEGFVTDTSYANIAFRRGTDWYTPSTRLLPGTMRQSLLDRNIIQSLTIRKEDIPTFDSFRLMNAMIGFDGPEVDVSNIVF